jgi:transcriptional regulator with GAF, ATPase, and Fis domain
VSDAAGRAERLSALVAEARAAGEYPALAAAWRRLAREVAAPAPGAPPGCFGMIGDSPPMRELYDLLGRVAASEIPVLVRGETGTGKELVARALHDASPRAAGPFLAENCAAVPAGLLESELFGHVKGAFTDAVADRKGTFVEADGGTVFLDEIGDMPLEMQAKLLRVLQEGEVRPVGSNRTRRVDVRLVAATHRDLTARCAEGLFREDLLYRLDVVTLQLPPLRERGEDVELLARHFASRAAEQVGREVVLSDAALEALRAWRWPGNVRELENEILRAAVLADGEIRPEDLSPRLLEGV